MVPDNTAGSGSTPVQAPGFPIGEPIKRGDPRASSVNADKLSTIELFTYHKPDENQILQLDMVRGGAIALADTIEAVCPPGADRSAAIRKLRECVHVAAASIMLRGRI